MNLIRNVAVVIPAHDESELIDRCLDAVTVARERVSRELGDRVTITVIVVADGCTDDTVVRVARHPGVEVYEIPRGGVGVARSRGVARAIASVQVHPRQLWLANTDADSEVASDWLVEQIAVANAGADVTIGAVRPRFADLTSEQIRAWRFLRRRGRSIGHVHGANLGIRASSYLLAGGFPGLAEHEDVQLVERLRTGGALVALSPGTDVTTSGRRLGRTPGGYAAYLDRDLIPLAGL